MQTPEVSLTQLHMSIVSSPDYCAQHTDSNFLVQPCKKNPHHFMWRLHECGHCLSRINLAYFTRKSSQNWLWWLRNSRVFHCFLHYRKWYHFIVFHIWEFYKRKREQNKQPLKERITYLWGTTCKKEMWSFLSHIWIWNYLLLKKKYVKNKSNKILHEVMFQGTTLS